MSEMPSPNSCGEICYAVQLQAPNMSLPQSNAYSLPLPAKTLDQAACFLEGLGGDAVGAGRAMTRIGINAPQIRATYKREVEGMIAELARRLEAGESKEVVARWASTERNRIIAKLRSGSGMVTRGIYEVRDWREYGYGGRTWNNITRRYEARGLRGDKMYDHIIKGAQKSNPNVNNAAMRGASYLKHGGRVVLVVGVAISAARIWNASDEELPRVIGEELGGFIGGGIGAGAGVGICIIFGIATSGWGLLACGVVGGVGGGVAGSYAGGKITDGIYYSDANTPAHMLGQVTIEIPKQQLYTVPPAAMCVPSQ